LVFKGQGEIKDFPGNYTQYREFTSTREEGRGKKEDNSRYEVRGTRCEDSSAGEGNLVPRTSHLAPRKENAPRRKFTFKEKREFEQLEKDIEVLETEKKQIEAALCGGTVSVEEITKLSKRLPLLNEELDEKSMRWLELSEIEN
jgi:ATP-binding cassette subfamily F protein uup